jgi:hypothetical protein
MGENENLQPMYSLRIALSAAKNSTTRAHDMSTVRVFDAPNLRAFVALLHDTFERAAVAGQEPGLDDVISALKLPDGFVSKRDFLMQQQADLNLLIDMLIGEAATPEDFQREQVAQSFRYQILKNGVHLITRDYRTPTFVH